MKKKIAILGSTGSIGKTTIKIIKKNSELFDIVLLTTNKNIKEVYNQARKLNVNNIIVSDKTKYLELKKKMKNYKCNIYNDFSFFKKIFNKKIDYTMSSISGLDGLNPTLNIIKYTKNIAIANKESIICGWNLISKELRKNSTSFIPVDSEHFSIWSSINKVDIKLIDKIYLTASGGPFLNISNSKLTNTKPNDAIKHPRWKMGKKISIDSSNLMNKVFEVVEASRIFNLSPKKFEIITHPDSYLHSIVRFNNGINKLLIHDTSMKIPIFNSIFSNYEKKYKSKKINFERLNNLNLKKPNRKKFPNLKILNHIPNKISLFETILVSANDELVSMFLNSKIKYLEIHKYLIRILNMSQFKKYKKKHKFNTKEIFKLSYEVKKIIRNIL